MSPLAQELVLASVQGIRLYREFMMKAADGSMSDEELERAFDALEDKKQSVRDKLAARKAELMAKEGQGV